MSPEEPARQSNTTDTPWTPPPINNLHPSPGNRVPLVLSVIALLLSASAIGVSVGVSGKSGPAGVAGATGGRGPAGVNGTQGPPGGTGPAGANGSQGPPGVPGPGAQIFEKGTTQSEGMSNTTCTSYADSSVNVTATAPGTVVLSAAVTLEWIHTIPNPAVLDLWLSNSTSGCTGPWSLTYFPGDTPAGTYENTITVLRTFNVSNAGTFTFQVEGYSFGTGIDQATYEPNSVVIAVYYPT